MNPLGSGKSLSYQLPAYIFSKLGIPSLALVISPMISLMQDQVKCLPRELKGAAWTSVEQTVCFFDWSGSFYESDGQGGNFLTRILFFIFTDGAVQGIYGQPYIQRDQNSLYLT